MFTVEVTIVFLLMLIAWFWSVSMKSREIGLHLVKKACVDEGVQLLDESIVCTKLSFHRQRTGQWAIQRVYQFDFSEDGLNRRRGAIHLLGSELTFLSLGLRAVH
ncbi:MAG: DUF3301 domain-containing protein [Gammaproteobacteria bacterium]|nr:DUF3301 domain-containing protein [Gammaproteobacteria bacterium]NBT43665.1 DUF3301 domain-containing protein [Gammaproteobacteria bacterium]NBY23787.1 DUF3301 domain-containing protein [Gammaproteobacteria bacterium]